MGDAQNDLFGEKIQVPSMTDPDVTYEIDPKEKTCTCPAFTKAHGKKPCKHLYEHGIVKKKMILYPVRPNYSQAMSAYVKSVRLRNLEDALYWLIYLYEDHQDKIFRIRRRVWIASAEDCQNLKVQRIATNWFAGKESKITPKNKPDIIGAMKVTYAICKTKNWYEDKSAQDYIHCWPLAEKEAKIIDKEKWPYSERLTRLEVAINNKQAVTALAYICTLAGGTPKEKQQLYSLLRDKAVGLGCKEAQQNIEDFNVKGGRDINFLGHCVYRLTEGNFGEQRLVVIDKQELANAIHLAEGRWKNPKPVPKHYCDGLHCAGEDRRFSGMSTDMWAAVQAYNYYGRLSPKDKWLPQFYKY